MFWSFGKIHGLENIAFADPKEVYETKGNPIKIQQIVDKVEGYPTTADSFESLVHQLESSLEDY